MRRAVLPILLVAVALPAPASAAPRAVRGAEADIGSARAPVSQLREERTVIAGRRRITRYRQVVVGLPVLGTDTVVTEAPGSSGDLLIDGTRTVSAPPRATVRRARAVRAALGGRSPFGRVVASRAVYPVPSGARTVWRVVYRTRTPVGAFEALVDARTARVLRRRSLVRRAAQEARVFDNNALTAQPGPRGLLADDSLDADFALLYSVVALERLQDPDCLIGDYVKLNSPDFPIDPVCRQDADFTVVTDPDDPPNEIPLTRSFNEFEAAMAYFHIDRLQDGIQSIGVLNANNRQTRVDVNFNDEDNSFYLPDGLGTGSIVFGAGGVDDAEDGDVIVHEYGHAIQDNQVPGFGETLQGGAMGEGFADYLAAAAASEFSPRPGYDECFAEWDYSAVEPDDDPPCLRRVDRNITFAQAQAGQGCSDPGEFIYCGGEAWSGALWDIRTTLGIADSVADRKVIESHFSLTPQSDLHAGALALVAAYAGEPEQAAVRALLIQRGLLDTERLDDTLAAATALSVPGSRSGFLQFGRDNDDVLRIGLTSGQGVLIRLRGAAGDFDLRLLRPGATDLDQATALVAQAETAGSNEDLSYRPTVTGLYHLDVRAFQGQGNYSVQILIDRDSDTRPDAEDNCAGASNPGQEDADGDRLGDACDRFPDDRANDADSDGRGATEDNCPQVANGPQTDWDGDDRGDACDASSKVTIKKLRQRGRKITLRATYRPTLLGGRAVTLRFQKRRCTSKRKRCKFGKVTSRRRGRDRGAGRVDFTVTVRRGYSYRFRARLTDRRFAATSKTLGLRLR